MALTDTYLPYGNVVGSMSKEDKGLLGNFVSVQSLFQYRIKAVKNAGDKNGLKFNNLLFFLKKNIPNINAPLKYRCAIQHEILKVICNCRSKRL